MKRLEFLLKSVTFNNKVIDASIVSLFKDSGLSQRQGIKNLIKECYNSLKEDDVFGEDSSTDDKDFVSEIISLIKLIEKTELDEKQNKENNNILSRLASAEKHRRASKSVKKLSDDELDELSSVNV